MDMLSVSCLSEPYSIGLMAHQTWVSHHRRLIYHFSFAGQMHFQHCQSTEGKLKLLC